MVPLTSVLVMWSNTRLDPRRNGLSAAGDRSGMGNPWSWITDYARWGVAQHLIVAGCDVVAVDPNDRARVSARGDGPRILVASGGAGSCSIVQPLDEAAEQAGENRPIDALSVSTALRGEG